MLSSSFSPSRKISRFAASPVGASWGLSADFIKLAHNAPDDVATDVAKQEKFLEGLNDELSMQLMVSTFNNYQELVVKEICPRGNNKVIIYFPIS